MAASAALPPGAASAVCASCLAGPPGVAGCALSALTLNRPSWTMYPCMASRQLLHFRREQDRSSSGRDLTLSQAANGQGFKQQEARSLKGLTHDTASPSQGLIKGESRTGLTDNPEWWPAEGT